MHKVFKSVWLMLLSLAFAPCLMAQDATPAESNTAVTQVTGEAGAMTLSLEQAVNYALEHNRSLKNASLDVQKAEMQRWQTIASMLPQMDASFQYVNMCGHEYNMAEALSGGASGASAMGGAGGQQGEAGQDAAMMGKSAMTKSNPYHQFGFSITAGVSVQGIIGAQIQRMSKQIKEVQVVKSEQETKYQVESSYITILALEKTVNLLEQNVSNLEKLKSMTENAVKAGVCEQNDADQISITVASLKNGINSAKRSIESLYNALILTIGASSETKITLSQTLEDVVNDGKIMELMGSTLDLNDNLDYQLLMKSSEITDKQKQMAVAAFFPTVGLSYQVNPKEWKHYYGDGNSSFSDLMTPPQTFAAAVQIPIFSSGKRTCAVKEAKISQQETANTIEDTEIGLRIKEKQLKYNLTSAYETYTVQKENIKVMSNVFNSYEQKFKYGKASSMDVTQSSTNLTEAQRNYVNSVLEMVNAFIDLKKLLNK